MQVGIDTFSISSLGADAFGQLDWIKSHGFEGAQFGVLGTDAAELQKIRIYADDMGLYSHTSVSSPNPVIFDEAEDKLYDLIVQQVEAAASAGWHELHSTLGADGNRYRSAVAWPVQLDASCVMLKRLSPVLKEFSSRINLETHFDTTTFELLRMVEAVGQDVCGICLDTANVMLFGEHPIEAARRAAPYTHLTHIKDGLLYMDHRGLKRAGRAPGSGSVDFREILPILGKYSPDLPLSIEDHKWLFGAEIFEASWHEQQADLSREELGRVVGLAWAGQQRIISGEEPDPDEYEKIEYKDEMEARLHAGRDYLNGVIEEHNLRTKPLKATKESV
jgi:sugar phosphate isomerase/epimerase